MFPRPSCGDGYGHNHFGETEIERKARLHKEDVAKTKMSKTDKSGRVPVAA